MWRYFCVIFLSSATIAASFTPSRSAYHHVVLDAQELIAHFSDAQKTRLVLDYNAKERTRGFCYVLALCPTEYAGIKLADLNQEQNIALHQLLVTLLGTAGYHKAIGIMNRENLLTKIEDMYRQHPDLFAPATGELKEFVPPPIRSSENYYIAFFGHVNDQQDWGFRLEGHHLTLNFNFKHVQDKLYVSATPFFFGASPMMVTSIDSQTDKTIGIDKNVGQMLLGKEVMLARQLVNSFTSEQAKQASWGEMPRVALAGGTEDFPKATPQQRGIVVKDFTDEQKETLYAIVEEFLNIHNRNLVDTKFYVDSITHAKIAWFGQKQGRYVPSYLRIESPAFLIEILQSPHYSTNAKSFHNGNVANHIHSVFRDLHNDFDYDILANHHRLSHRHKHL